MKAINRLRIHIQTGMSQGHLKPGSRLPSYENLMHICDASYVTVHSAMSQLAREGIVRIENGNGCFVAGGHVIKIRLEIPFEGIQPSELSALLQKHLKNTGYDFDFEIHSIYEPREYDCTANTVIMIGGRNYLDGFPCTDFSDQKGYNALLSTLELPDHANIGYKLPFSCSVGMMGVNAKKFRRIGMKSSDFTTGFRHWKDFSEKCRAAGFPPSSIAWTPDDFDLPEQFYQLLYVLNDGRNDNIHSSLPLFSGKAGKKLFEILEDISFYKSNVENNIPDSFFCGGAALHFNVGNWIVRQNKTKRRPDIHVDELEIVPYYLKGRRIFSRKTDFLQCYLPTRTTPEDKATIWKLMTILCSAEFQLDYAGVTGFMATHKSIRPHDVAWNRNGEWDVFFPQKNDLNLRFPFKQTTTAAFSSIIGCWKNGEISGDIGKILDRIKNEVRPINSYLHV